MSGDNGNALGDLVYDIRRQNSERYTYESSVYQTDSDHTQKGSRRVKAMKWVSSDEDMDEYLKPYTIKANDPYGKKD